MLAVMATQQMYASPFARIKEGAGNLIRKGKVALSTAKYNYERYRAKDENGKQIAAQKHGSRLAKLGHKNYADYFENDRKVKAPIDENMFYAAENRHTHEMGLLIKAGANPNATDTKGKTALHYAALRGDKKTAKALLKHDANINAIDIAQKTPLDYAIDNPTINNAIEVKKFTYARDMLLQPDTSTKHTKKILQANNPDIFPKDSIDTEKFIREKGGKKGTQKEEIKDYLNKEREKNGQLPFSKEEIKKHFPALVE
jgi:hypothetical protein